MEKYMVCPYCGKHNPPKMLECIQCETDLSNVRVIDEEIEQKSVEKKEQAETAAKMVRVCDCGAHNPVNARKCENCGEDISDVVPVEEYKEKQVDDHFVLASLDGAYTYELAEPSIIIGREAVMQEYLSAKLYVSRQHAELIVEGNCLFIRNISQTNYTYVNNIKIPEGKQELHDGDEIGLGGNMQNGNRQDEAAYFQVRIGSCI